MYPSINPILVQVGPLALHWYGIIMTLAIFSGTFTASRYVTRHGGDGNVVWDILLWVLLPAIVGARLYYVFIQSPRNDSSNGFLHYMSHPLEIIQVWQGGLHIYGALIFGAITLFIYLRLHKLPVALYLDGIGLGLALGQAIGRFGNFINQELYGPPTTLPWGLRIDQIHRIPPYDNLILYPESIRFQPLFLYEMLWDLIGFALLLWVAHYFAKRLRKGDLFLLYLLWVPFGRFFLEFLRTDSWFFPGTPFNVVHPIIAVLVIGSAITLFRRHRTAPAGLQGQDERDNAAFQEPTSDLENSGATSRGSQAAVSPDTETTRPLATADTGTATTINAPVPADDTDPADRTELLANRSSANPIAQKKRIPKDATVTTETNPSGLES